MVKRGATMRGMDKTVKMNVTIRAGLLEQVKALAEKDNRNLSNMVTHLIQKGLKSKAA
jgi:hypothetical protein